MLSLQDPAFKRSSGGDPQTWEFVIPDDRPGADPHDNVSCHELLSITKEVLAKLSDKEATILRLRFGLCEDIPLTNASVVSDSELDSIMLGKGLK